MINITITPDSRMAAGFTENAGVLEDKSVVYLVSKISLCETLRT